MSIGGSIGRLALAARRRAHSPLVFLIAGEPSGDAIGAKLMQELRRQVAHPALPHCRIAALAHCRIAALPHCRIAASPQRRSAASPQRRSAAAPQRRIAAAPQRRSAAAPQRRIAASPPRRRIGAAPPRRRRAHPAERTRPSLPAAPIVDSFRGRGRRAHAGMIFSHSPIFPICHTRVLLYTTCIFHAARGPPLALPNERALSRRVRRSGQLAPSTPLPPHPNRACDPHGVSRCGHRRRLERIQPARPPCDRLAGGSKSMGSRCRSRCGKLSHVAFLGSDVTHTHPSCPYMYVTDI